MAEVRTKKLQIERTHLADFAADPQFFEQCPAFRYLATAAAQQAAAFKTSTRCKQCGGDFKIMRPIVDLIFLGLRELKTQDPDGLGGFRQYLSNRKGFIPRPLTLYYRRGNKGQIGKLTL